MIKIINKHLSYILEHAKRYTDDGEKIPDELLLHLIGELMVSNLIMPVSEEDEGFIFENIALEDESYLPLFTSIEEFEKHTEEFEPMSNEFNLYLEIVEESGLEGIIIDIEGLNMTFDRQFLSQIPKDTQVSFTGYGDAYDACELKEIFNSISNEEFVEFMQKSIDHDDVESLMVELSNCHLLNGVISDENLDEFAEDGIIKSEDVDGFNLFIVDEDSIHLAVLFTSKAEMIDTVKDCDDYIYGQITILTDLFEFILRNDLDGIVINPNSQSQYVLREEIISQARGIELIPEDDRFRDSLDYAFLL